MRSSLLAVSLLLAAHAAAELRVIVRGADGQPVRDAYVAVAAPDRPFSRPTYEAIAPRGVVSADVPPGIYQLLIAARGFQQEVRSVRVGEKTEVSFALMPAIALRGVVVDAEGKAIEGARVRQLRAVGPERLAVVSELARTTFASDWSACTDAAGRWRMEGRGDGCMPLLIEAEIRRAASLPRSD